MYLTYIILQSGKSLNSSKSVPILHEAEGKENKTRRFSELVSAQLDAVYFSETLKTNDLIDFHHPVQAKNLNFNSYNHFILLSIKYSIQSCTQPLLLSL